MDVIEAIMARRSVRDFSSRPVTKDTIKKIIEAAIQTPSGGNGQPWEVFAASGAALERIRKVYLERAQNPTGVPGGPPPQRPHHQERMATIKRERLVLLGLDPDDPASDRVFKEWAARLYGAPVLLILCMDKSLPAFRKFEIGSFAQTVCLAAQGYGVDSFIAGGFVNHHDVLRKELEIPDDLDILIGIGLGYANPESIINTYRSPRRQVEEVVRFKS
jgi:nitroreductase